MFKKIVMSTRQKILTYAFLSTVQFRKIHRPEFRKNIFFGSKVKPEHRFFLNLKKWYFPFSKKIKNKLFQTSWVQTFIWKNKNMGLEKCCQLGITPKLMFMNMFVCPKTIIGAQKICDNAVNFRKKWKNVILAILERSGARCEALCNL